MLQRTCHHSLSYQSLTKYKSLQKDVWTHAPVPFLFGLPVTSFVCIDGGARYFIKNRFKPLWFVAFIHHTLLLGFCSLCFSPAPSCTLLFLQLLFLLICLIPSAVFHEALIGPQTWVCQSYRFLWLIESQCKLCETVHFLVTSPVRMKTRNAMNKTKNNINLQIVAAYITCPQFCKHCNMISNAGSAVDARCRGKPLRSWKLTGTGTGTGNSLAAISDFVFSGLILLS